MNDMDDEFAELDLTEAEIDAMMEAGTAVEIVNVPLPVSQQEVPYVQVVTATRTFGPYAIMSGFPGVTVTPISNSHAVTQTAKLVA